MNMNFINLNPNMGGTFMGSFWGGGRWCKIAPLPPTFWHSLKLW